MASQREKIKIPTLEELEEAEQNLSKMPVKAYFTAKYEEKLLKAAANVSASTSSGSQLNEIKATDHKEQASESIQYTESLHISKQTNESMSSNSQARTTFSDAFSNLRQSKHYVEEISPDTNTLPESKSSTPNLGIKTNAVLVNPKQKGNPILKFITKVPVEYSEIIPDFILGATTCALFLSIRYHNLFPNYIHDRLKQLGQQYKLRILLIQVDTKDPHHSLKELTKISILADCTLLLAWTPEEAGRYLETYKSFEFKPPDLIMERQENSSMSKLVDALTIIKSVNKSDAENLLSVFGSFDNILKANEEELSFVVGIGPQKAKRLYEVLHLPFLKTSEWKPSEYSLKKS